VLFGLEAMGADPARDLGRLLGEPARELRFSEQPQRPAVGAGRRQQIFCHAAA